MNEYFVEIDVYQTKGGKRPFETWLNAIVDGRALRLIHIRILRLSSGHFGDCKCLDGDLYELRIFYRPGYRIYFAKIGERSLLLLTGGTKHTQPHDLRNLRFYWKEYLNRNV